MKYQEKKEKNNGVARVKRTANPIFEMFDSSQVSIEAMPHWIALQEGLRENLVPCTDKPKFWADHSTLMSAQDAEEMCYGCPLIKQCYDYAVADKVNAGIWGGIHFDEDEGTLFD
jgi:hypothetical protein